MSTLVYGLFDNRQYKDSITQLKRLVLENSRVVETDEQNNKSNPILYLLNDGYWPRIDFSGNSIAA